MPSTPTIVYKVTDLPAVKDVYKIYTLSPGAKNYVHRGWLLAPPEGLSLVAQALAYFNDLATAGGKTEKLVGFQIGDKAGQFSFLPNRPPAGAEATGMVVTLGDWMRKLRSWAWGKWYDLFYLAPSPTGAAPNATAVGAVWLDDVGLRYLYCALNPNYWAIRTAFAEGTGGWVLSYDDLPAQWLPPAKACDLGS